MIRLSMNQLTTYHWSFEEDLVRYAQAGYGVLGVWLRKLRDFGEERGAEMIADSGLGVSSVSWEGGFTGAGAASAAENIASTRASLALAATLGAECLVVHSGGRNNHTRGHAWRLFRHALDSLLPFAEEFGVPIALEPMHAVCATEWTLLTDLKTALDLVREYDSPGLKLAIDTYHFPIGRCDTPVLAELAPHLATVYLSDRAEPHDIDQRRCPLGEGSAPIGEVVRVLQQAGYTGCFEVKLFGAGFRANGYADLLHDSRAAAERIVDPAPAAPRCEASEEVVLATRLANQRTPVDSPERDPILVRP